EIARAVYGNAFGDIEPGVAARVVVSARRVGQAGDSAYHSGGRDLPDGVVASVGHIDVTRVVHGDALRFVEPRLAARAVVGAGASGQTGYSAYHAGGRDLSNRIVESIRHIEVAQAVHRDACRREEPGIAARIVGAAVRAGQTSERADHAGGRDLPN